MTVLADAPAVAPVKDAEDNRHYPYPPTGEPLWSVTTAIGGTDNKSWVKKWYGRSSTRWCVDHITEIARTKRAKGTEAAVKLGENAAENERQLKADAGKHVHRVLKALNDWADLPDSIAELLEIPPLPDHLAGALYDLGNGESRPLADVVADMVDGFTAFVAAFGDSMRIVYPELTVYNVELGYAGTLDMIVILTGYAVSRGTGPKGSDRIVACPGNVLVLIVDAKTGKAQEGTWKEQLAAYMGATECANALGDMRPMPPADGAAVLHLRPDYPGGWNLFLVSEKDRRAGWERFCKALSIFTERQEVKDKPGTVIRPLRPDGTMPGPRLCDVRSEGYGRALAPLRKALGDASELEVIAAFTAAELLAVRGVGPKLVDTVREMLADQQPPMYLAGEEPGGVPCEAAA